MGLFGVLIERVFLRPLTKKGGGYTVAGMGIIICGFGLSVVLLNLAYIIWNPTAHPFRAELGLPINIGGQKIESGDVIVADSGGVIVGPHCKKDFFINWFCQVTN